MFFPPRTTVLELVHMKMPLDQSPRLLAHADLDRNQVLVCLLYRLVNKVRIQPLFYSDFVDWSFWWHTTQLQLNDFEAVHQIGCTFVHLKFGVMGCQTKAVVFSHRSIPCSLVVKTVLLLGIVETQVNRVEYLLGF